MQSAERQIQFSAKKEGVITCFLSLVLMILLALVSVTLESARLAGARFLTESYTRMAKNSVMAGYSGALFDRYHIFAYNSRAGTDAGIRYALETKTAYYINRNLQTENRMLWTPVLHAVNAQTYTLLTDDAGEAFRAGAVEYMKYKGSSLLVEKLLSSLGVFQGAQETTKLLETKTETEEALAEVDACVLELFESVDGFIRDDSGIKQNLWGKVKIKKYFVKKLLAVPPTKESTQINHPELLEAVQTHYLNPQEAFAEMAERLREYENAQGELERIEKRLAELEEEELLLKPELKLEQAVLEAERLFYQGEQLIAKQRYFAGLRSWRATVEGCKEAVNKALTTIELIRVRQTLTKSTVLQYEKQLMDAVKWLDASLYEELSEGLDTMKGYVGLGSTGAERLPNIDRMEATLEQNAHALEQMSAVIGTDGEEGEAMNRQERKRLAQMISLMGEYSHEGLCFDYSGIRLKAEGKSPADSLEELLGMGITALVMNDPGAVSQAVLNGAELPSRLQDIDAGNGSKGDVTNLRLSLNQNSPFAGIGEWVMKKGTELTERLLFLSYLGEHFLNYADMERETGEPESVLAYEQEYILCGNTQDASNLYEVVGRLLSVRAIFNLIHVLSDAEKCNVAGETALGLLGVTGLPILVSIMKYLLLSVWAVEAALVETAAILQGKSLPLLPVKSEFPVSFPELLLMTKTRIQEKAAELPDKQGLSFGYQEYMMLFLLLQKEEIQCMRALDLIQENLASEEPGFRAVQQVCSFEVQAEYLLPELFTALPFSKRRTGGYVL